jgi:ferric iron reductase protein FhuF
LYHELQLSRVNLSEYDFIIDASVFVHNRKTSLSLLAKAYDYLLTMSVMVAIVWNDPLEK